MTESKKVRVVSAETREKMRAARLGKTHSDETKEKIRQKMLDNGNGERTRFGKPGWVSWNTGRAEMVNGVCEKCSVPFARPKSRKDNKRFCSQSCAYQSRSGEQHPGWKGPDNTLECNGYRMVRKESGGYQYEHVAIATKALGRPLKKCEVVHHLNGDKQDNDRRNLLVCTNAYHRALEHRMCRMYQHEHFPSFRNNLTLTSGG